MNQITSVQNCHASDNAQKKVALKLIHREACVLCHKVFQGTLLSKIGISLLSSQQRNLNLEIC